MHAPRKLKLMQPAAQQSRVWLRVKYTKPYTLVTLVVPVAPGHFQSFSAKVDNRMVLRALRRHGVEIGFSLGGLWKGVKKVAKKIGVTKVLNVAKKVLQNPIVTAVFPVASIASRAVSSGVDMLNAATAAKKGTPKAKAAGRALLKRAASRAKAGDPVASNALKLASRVYQIQVQPL